MDFPENEAPITTTAISIRLPSPLLKRIDEDVAGTKESRSERIIYLLEYAYQAGSLNQFIDLMKAQYLEILATTPQQLSEGVSTYNQVNNLENHVNEIDDKLEIITEELKRIS